MTVSCRIVGIYFNAENLPYTQDMTVQELMDNIAKDPGLGGSGASNFGYIANQDILTTGGASVVAFAARYPQGVTSLTSKTKYVAGDYYLSEQNVGAPRYSVWQYYIFDKDGKFEPNPKPLQSFSTRILDDGDTVIWRLVEILSGPNTVPRVYQSALGFGSAQRTVYGFVSADATNYSGSGIAGISVVSPGLYQIEFATPFTTLPAVIATQQFDNGGGNPGSLLDNAIVSDIQLGSCRIATGDSTGNLSARNFSFEATGV